MGLEPAVPKLARLAAVFTTVLFRTMIVSFTLEHFIPNTRVFGSCEVVNGAEYVLRVVIAGLTYVFLTCGVEGNQHIKEEE
jgi:hypothetical protein